MSYFAPQNWDEIIFAVERGFATVARRHGISAERVAVCSRHYEPHMHVNDFARRVLDGAESLHRDYICGHDRSKAWFHDTPLYILRRDGDIIAYVDRGGSVHVDPEIDTRPRRYRDGVARLMPALETYAKKVAAEPQSEWL